MKIKIPLLIGLLLVILVGCKAKSNLNTKKELVKKSIPKREHSVQALLWQQQSAEYKSLAYQAYNLAKMQLDVILKTKKGQPIAIITDIDETVLDNSPYNARMVESDQNYTSKTWKTWVNESIAKPVPGALSFFNYAAKNKVAIFYISNRNHILKEATIINLKKVGFPNVDKKHVLLKTVTSGKEPRRQSVLKTHEIVMLLGDNLSDFSAVFDKKNTKTRNKLTQELQQIFGVKYIVLPNPMYGDWETKGIYESSYKWTEKQKDSIRKAKLKIN